MMRRIAAAIRATDWMDQEMTDETPDTPDMLDTMSMLISQSLDMNRHLEQGE